MAEKIIAEYIWIDGQRPRAMLRSKAKILSFRPERLEDVPEWGYDGSSTFQAETVSSDLTLKPVCFVPDPVRGNPHILVLCEVFYPDGRVHPSNTRSSLRAVVKKYKDHEPLFGVEQEYTLYDQDGVRPLRWPEGAAFPSPQGRYYCGVGCDEVYGRELIEAHLRACLEAGISITGINAEVMPAQWEFQVGPGGALETADELWLSRWLLYRLGENFGISVKLDPKPIAGDWNGAGAHTNFSTRAMRESYEAIVKACERLKKFHKQHIAVYGPDNDKRLTGRHETCHIRQFRWGVADRGASVRIPAAVNKAGKGYLEDRRPAANIDPYKVFTALLETICGNGFRPKRRWIELKI